MLTFMDKAIVAFIVPAIVAGISGFLAGVGITGDMSVETAITMLATGAITFLVPNKKTP